MGQEKTRDALMDVAQEAIVTGLGDDAAAEALVARGASPTEAIRIVAEVKDHPITRAILSAK